ncbi:uncharacterized protein [Eurosta solidaginis]|uniref:uncharacterized protein isoform X2 n=1 Tax=Eurosta solidaginis TaxID=178769 RepID=UPI0035313D7E
MHRTPPRRSPRLANENITPITSVSSSMDNNSKTTNLLKSASSTPSTSGATKTAHPITATLVNTTTTTVTNTAVTTEANRTNSNTAVTTDQQKSASVLTPITTHIAGLGNMENQQVSFLLEKLNSLETQLRDTQAQLRESNNQRATYEESLRLSGYSAMPTSNATVGRAQSSDVAVFLAAQNGTPSNIAVPEFSVGNMQNSVSPYFSHGNVFANSHSLPPISARAPTSQYANSFIATSSGQTITTSAYPNSHVNGLPPMQLPNMSNSYSAPRKVQDLPEFSGCPEDWPLFSNVFYQSTAVYGYTNMENNQRLLKGLKGEAREVVKSLLIHPDNVGAVMDQLKIRFGRPELLIRSQLRQVREIPPISEAAIDKLIPFASKTKNLAIFLQSVNGYQHLANPSLLDELIGKLPMSKKMDWAKYASAIKPYPTIADFSNWLTEVANLVCTLQDCEGRRSRVVLHAVENNNKENVKVEKDRLKGTATCAICRGQHKVHTCKKFLESNAANRWAEVKRHHLCFSCLKNGHSARECRNRVMCSANGCQR